MDNGNPSIATIYGYMQQWFDGKDIDIEDLEHWTDEQVIAEAEEALESFGVSHQDAAQWMKANMRNLTVVFHHFVGDHAERILTVLGHFVDKHECGGPALADVAADLNAYIAESGMCAASWLDNMTDDPSDFLAAVHSVLVSDGYTVEQFAEWAECHWEAGNVQEFWNISEEDQE